MEIRPFVAPDQHIKDTAPDGSTLALLTRSAAASMCLGELAAGEISKTVSHRTVEELWLVLSGKGEFYSSGFDGGPVAIEQGSSFTIPPRTRFQFRNVGRDPLKFVFTTIPAWPGPAEVIEHEHGRW